MSTTTTTIEKSQVETTFEQLIGWSPQGCTATTRQASKLLAPLTTEELVLLHVKFGEHYAHWYQYAEPDLDIDRENGDIAYDDDLSETTMAVEEMHDALRARSLIHHDIMLRGLAEQKAKKAAKLHAVK